MRRSTSVSALVSILALIATSWLQPCFAANYYVRTVGSDSNTGLNANSAFRTVGKAIAECSASDVIYVGAGTYDEAITKRYSSSYESLRVVGDTTGRYTGDKGSVVFRPKPGRWFLNIGNMQNFQITNVEFSDPGITTGYGIYVINCTGYAYVIDCSFNRLRHGFYSNNSNFALSYRSSFRDSTYGFFSTKSRYAYAYQCEFESCRYGASAQDSEFAYFYNCSSKSDPAVTGGYSRAFYALRSSVYAYNLTSQNDNYCLLGSGLTSANVYNCTVNEPTSAGVQLAGTQLICSNVSVKGDESRKGYGIVLNDTEGGSFQLQNCSAVGLYGGLLMYTPGTLSQVSFEKNHIGIRFVGGDRQIAIDGSRGVNLKDNTYGVYGYAPSGSQGQLLLSNLKITGGSYGIYTSRMSPNIKGQAITGAINAIRSHECDSFVLSDSKIDSAAVENASTGALVYSKSCSIDRVSVNGFRNGLNLQNQSDAEARLSDCTLTNCSSYAVHFRGGKARVDANSNIRIADCRIGFYPYDCDFVIDGLTSPERCELPFHCTYGSLQASNLNLSGHRTGIYTARQTKTVIDNCKISECTGWGVDVYQSEVVQMSNLSSVSNGYGGFQFTRPSKLLSVENVVATDNRTYGIYCNADTTTPEVSFQNVRCSGSTYGLRTIGLAIDNTSVSGLEIVDNNHGLRTERAPLQLDAQSKVTLAGNSYALMSYYGSMQLDGIEIQDNVNGVYCWDSPLELKDCSISTDGYGVLAYKGGSKISGSTFSNSRYGVYFSPRTAGDRDLVISDCDFKDIAYMGLYSYGYQGDATIQAERLNVDAATYALYTIATDLKLSNSLLNADTHTLYGRTGRSLVSNCQINSKNGWGVLDYSKELRLDNSQVRSRYGVYLRCDYAKLRNNVIQGSTYGVYGNLASGKFEILQSTIGNITHYGLYRVAGDMIVRNTIVDANIYAMYNSGNPGTLEHDHNLVHADRASFVGVQPGIAEIDKDPIFLDPAKGDLHLAAGSPAINSGVDLTSELSADIEGNARPSFKQFEIGAYEFTENDGSIRVLEWDEKAN